MKSLTGNELVLPDNTIRQFEDQLCGRLSRTYGLPTDNLLSVDIVTAAGKVRTASKDEHGDLFWGIRGSGGNFGIVTPFEFRLHEVGPTVLFEPIFYPTSSHTQ